MKDFKELILSIELLHNRLQASASNAVNQSLTIRNWLIGCYIVEFEQKGSDRASNGERLIDNLTEKLSHIKGIDRRSLFKFRQFYLNYPQLWHVINGVFTSNISNNEIVGTVFPLLTSPEIVGTANPQSEVGLHVPPEKIISSLSYSHIELLLNIHDKLKRTFYELECIKATWNVRELKRQINSLYFERKRPSFGVIRNS